MFLAPYAGLFGWSFAAATFLPLGSEVPFAYLVRTHESLLLPTAVATAGNYLGACTTYWIARGAVVGIERRRKSPMQISPRQARALEFVRRHGAPALLLSWVPVLGDALVAASGGLRVSFGRASLFLVTGKLARYLAVGWAALTLGR